jgi:hypothetical protein
MGVDKTNKIAIEEQNFKIKFAYTRAIFKKNGNIIILLTLILKLCTSIQLEIM